MDFVYVLLYFKQTLSLSFPWWAIWIEIDIQPALLSLGKDEATRITFIPLVRVKKKRKMNTVLDMNSARHTRKLAGRGQRGNSVKALEDVKI